MNHEIVCSCGFKSKLFQEELAPNRGNHHLRQCPLWSSADGLKEALRKRQNREALKKKLDEVGDVDIVIEYDTDTPKKE